MDKVSVIIVYNLQPSSTLLIRMIIYKMGIYLLPNFLTTKTMVIICKCL